MKIPSREQCFELLDKYGMKGEFSNIKQHSIIVEKVAMFLARKLNERGENVNLELMSGVALLHDIGKPDEIRVTRQGGGHGEIGLKILSKEGYPEIGEIVKRHILTYLTKEDFKNWKWEEKIIQYADDRVNNNKIVTLKERFEYFYKRYGSISGETMKFFEKVRPIAFELEKHICEKAGIKPKELLKLNEEN